MEQKIAFQQLLDLLGGTPGTRRLVMFSGLPGSGKSLLAKGLGKRGLVRVSVDRIQKHNKMAAILPLHLWRLYDAELKAAMRAGLAIVDDNLNLTAQSRKGTLKLARNHGYDVIVVRVDTPLEECLRRNAARKRVVPQDAIFEMWHEMHDDGPIGDVGVRVFTVSRLGPVSDLYELNFQSVY